MYAALTMWLTFFLCEQAAKYTTEMISPNKPLEQAYQIFAFSFLLLITASWAAIVVQQYMKRIIKGNSYLADEE